MFPFWICVSHPYDFNLEERYSAHFAWEFVPGTLGPKSTCVFTKEYAESSLNFGAGGREGVLFITVCVFVSSVGLEQEKKNKEEKSKKE